MQARAIYHPASALAGVPLKRYAPYYRPAGLVDVDKGTPGVSAEYDPCGAARALHARGVGLAGAQARPRGGGRETGGAGAGA